MVEVMHTAHGQQHAIQWPLESTAEMIKRPSVRAKIAPCLLQDLVEEGILVSPRMMADHMPDYLTATLQRMAKERAAPGQQRPLDAPDAVQEFQDSVRAHGKPSGKGHPDSEEEHSHAQHEA